MGKLDERIREILDKLDPKEKEILMQLDTGQFKTLIQKATEEFVKESEKRFKDLVETTPDWIWEVDENGVYTYVSPKIKDMLGYSPEEIVGRTPFDIMPEDEAEKIAKIFGDIIKNKKPFSALENWNVHKNGTKVLFESSGVPVLDEKGNLMGYRGIDRDITERKQAEAALRESETQFSNIIENNLDGVVVLDKESRTVYYVNPAAESILGVKAEEIEKKSFGFPAVSDEVAELDIQRKDREKLTVEMRVTEILWKGKPAYLAMLRDITERERATEEKAELEEQLHQAQKMESLGQLAGGVSHDFNNLLAVIIGYGDMLASSIPDDDPNYKKVEEIRKAAYRAVSLTRQLLAFSRKQTARPRIVNLNNSIKGLYKMLSRLIGEDIEIEYIPEENLGNISIDPGQFEQVIMNLSVNARDAMPRGGKLTIETANVYFDEGKCLRDMEPGKYVMLAVTDTGHGIGEEKLDRIFEPFYTTKEKGRGTGLGLSTVYGIIKQNQGGIDVDSEPGKGTSFKIYLPLAKDVEEREATAQHKVMKGSGTILLVEDELAVQRLTAEILEQQGYTVLRASDGREAIDLYEKSDAPIHLLLTDVVMPRMSGKELVEKIQTLNPGIKVLYMSGYTNDVLGRHGVLGEDINFIEKPYSPGDLTTRVRKLLD